MLDGTAPSTSMKTEDPLSTPPSMLSKSWLPKEKHFSEWFNGVRLCKSTGDSAKLVGGRAVNLAWSKENNAIGFLILKPRILLTVMVLTVLPSCSRWFKVTIP